MIAAAVITLLLLIASIVWVSVASCRGWFDVDQRSDEEREFESHGHE